MTCPVCIEPFTKLVRKKISCPYCEYEACSTCVQQYLVSTPETPHCMNCRKAWSRLFMVDAFTDKFVNTTYKKHRENVLFQFEKSLMPNTQDDVRRVSRKREIMREISTILVQMSVLREDIAQLVPMTIEDKRLECAMRTRYYKCTMEIETLKFESDLLSNSRRPDQQQQRKQFIRACPANGCKGFLSTAWKCGMCDTYTCPECHEIKAEGTEHACLPENIATAKLLDRDSKPCPQCASLIYKIDGCDQMFCTSCHTAFSWRTGRIETGRIHNPHYYEYQRTRSGLPREVGDIQCGGIPGYYTVQNACNRSRYVERLYRSLVHFNEVEMLRYRDINIMNPNRNLETRIEFMLGEITEDEFKHRIQKADKDLNKRLEIGQVATTLVQVITDLLLKLIEDKNVVKFVDEFHYARAYFNNSFMDISSSYKCSVPMIDTDGEIHMRSYAYVKTLPRHTHLSAAGPSEA